jgi:peptidoglycan/LPS O-acetylase OafA/YrhL
MTQARANKRESVVDGLRGLMLLIIVTTHYVPSTFFSGNVARPAAAVMLAVTGYFFMTVAERERGLTGNIFDRCRSAFSMLWQRHMRIWPALAGVVLLYVLLGYVDEGATTTQIHRTWPLYLGYMGNVVKMLYEGQAFPAHFWLISAQEQFIFAALIGLAVVGPTRFRRVLQILVVIGVLARIVGCALWMPEHPALATESPLAVADALALGMLCRIAISGGESKTQLRRRLILGALATFVIWAALPNTYAVYFGLMPLLTALIACIVILHLADEVRVRRLERAMLGWPGVVLLGQMSLSLFLLHPFVNTVINLTYAKETGQVVPWWLLSIVGPPASIMAAFCYFRVVEVPLRRARSRLGANRATTSRRTVPNWPVPKLAVQPQLSGHPAG